MCFIFAPLHQSLYVIGIAEVGGSSLCNHQGCGRRNRAGKSTIITTIRMNMILLQDYWRTSVLVAYWRIMIAPWGADTFLMVHHGATPNSVDVSPLNVHQKC